MYPDDIELYNQVVNHINSIYSESTPAYIKRRAILRMYGRFGGSFLSKN